MTYPAHDLHMLTYAAAMDGQRAVALQAARGFARLTNDSMLLSLVSCDSASSTRLPRSVNGRRTTSPPECGTSPEVRGAAPRRSQCRSGRPRSRAAAGSTSNAAFRIHPAKTLLGTVAAMLDGELQRAAGNAAAAIGAFEHAVGLQDTLLIDDPEPLPLAARHWLGAALLEQRRFADAERVYREDLARHPHNGWALTGLRQALAGTGKADERSGDRIFDRAGRGGCQGQRVAVLSRRWM